MSATREHTRFDCTRAGRIASSRNKLLVLLLGLCFAMLLFAVWTWRSTGRLVPTALVVAVAALAWTAWRMSGDLAPLWLELAPVDRSPSELTVQMKRARTSFPLDAVTARRLDDDERKHLEQLASLTGIVVGTGGFDSHRLGELDLFATDLEHAILVETGDQTLIVTPDDPERFLTQLQA